MSMTDSNSAKLGRPTKYRPEFCTRVIECGKEGMGKCEMAAELGITYDSFETYQQQHPDFFESVKAALRASQAWWESRGRQATFGAFDGYNATSYIFQMKNRFKDDWSDMTTVKHGMTEDMVALIAERRSNAAKVDG